MNTAFQLQSHGLSRRAFAFAGLAGATGVLSGCATLAVGALAAGGAAAVATDRRTSGAQLEDQAIELRAANRIKQVTLGAANIAVISYNRRVLLVGDMPSETLRTQITDAVMGVPNVKEVLNEITVGPNATLGQRGADSVLTGKIKSTLVAVRGVPSNSIKVVTNKNNAYLLGILTQMEADLATEATRRISGLNKVIVYFEIVTEEERNRLDLLKR